MPGGGFPEHLGGVPLGRSRSADQRLALGFPLRCLLLRPGWGRAGTVAGVHVRGAVLITAQRQPRLRVLLASPTPEPEGWRFAAFTTPLLAAGFALPSRCSASPRSRRCRRWDVVTMQVLALLYTPGSRLRVPARWRGSCAPHWQLAHRSLQAPPPTPGVPRCAASPAPALGVCTRARLYSRGVRTPEGPMPLSVWVCPVEYVPRELLHKL